MIDFDYFLRWEASTKDTIDFKKIYVDVAGDLVSGLMLSQIIYWHLPAQKTGKTKLRVKRNGRLWIAKTHADWWDEIRITAKQAARAIDRLESRGLIDVELFKFNGAPTIHISVNTINFLSEWNEQVRGNSNLPKRANGNVSNGQIEIPIRADSYTENTTKNTSENTNGKSMSEPLGSDVAGSNGNNGRKGRKRKQPIKCDHQAAIKLAKIVSSHIKVNCKSDLNQWASQFRLLREKDCVPKEDIKAAVFWYANHIGDEHIPEAFSGSTFRAKYVNGQIPAAMRRSQNNNNNGSRQPVLEKMLEECRERQAAAT